MAYGTRSYGGGSGAQWSVPKETRGFFFVNDARYEMVIEGIAYRAWIEQGGTYVPSGAPPEQAQGNLFPSETTYPSETLYPEV